jgi:hypothetical protein
MSKSAIRLLLLAIYTTALLTIPVATPAWSKTVHSKHAKKYKQFHSSRGPNFGRPSPMTALPRSSGAACPGNARSFDCKIWPPPFDEDPDRKMSGTDGG